LYRLPGLSLRAAHRIVEAAQETLSWWNSQGRPRELSVPEALRLTLWRLRRNLTYADLGEIFGIAASTAWEYVQEMTVFLREFLSLSPQEVRETVKGKICLVDGALVPTFNWRHRGDLYSGKHRRAGMNAQVVTDVHGRVTTASIPFPGAQHDKKCFEASDLSTVLVDAGGSVGDAGYQGADMVTPVKKQPRQERRECDKEFNRNLARLRAPVEQGIAHLKNWWILSTRYRSELDRLAGDLAVVTGLQRMNDFHSGRPMKLDRIAKIGLSE
jgi:hypothetical protein